MRILFRVVLLCVALAFPGWARAQEEVNPPVGGGTTTTRTVNGQIVEVTTVGPAEVVFTEISASRIAGSVIRLDPTPQICQATIRWVNRNLQQTVSVEPGDLPKLFCIESGDIDRRSGPNLIQ